VVSRPTRREWRGSTAPLCALAALLWGCDAPAQPSAREALNAYLAAHPAVSYQACPEAEVDDCGVNPDTASPSGAVLDCVYAAKQGCVPTWGCVPWATFDAAGEFCLLVEDGTCQILYFNPTPPQTCDGMAEPEDCFPTLTGCVEGD
jgi:hypothetical protein